MKKFIAHKITFLLLLCFAVSGCTEQYVMQTDTYESTLVVEATMTNELKKQQVKITRTYRLEEQAPQVETDAQVTVTDSDGGQYFFVEEGELYISQQEFQAVPGKMYRLNIVTSEGKSYTSTGEMLTPINEMQSVIPKVQNKNGERGVAIMVNSFDPTFQSKYYRYEYEETYKIIAPAWDDERTVLLPFETGQEHQGIAVIPRVGETETCYATKKSDEIIQTTTAILGEDRVNFDVRFISNKNYIIAHRYSILVRQYVQNPAAYTYYKTLKQLSGSENILSQNQPGFFYGNLKSTDNPNEKVIGFFEVASVSSKRIFFNYVDLFPSEPAPPYFTDCKIKEFKNCFNQSDPDCKGAALISVIGGNDLLYVDSDSQQAYFFMVNPPCGDCTTFASNVRPSFWTD